jgi:hypothetical protein
VELGHLITLQSLGLGRPMLRLGSPNRFSNRVRPEAGVDFCSRQMRDSIDDGFCTRSQRDCHCCSAVVTGCRQFLHVAMQRLRCFIETLAT